MLLNIFKHLLPSAKAWHLTIDKQLRQFFDGLTKPLIGDVKDFYDLIFLDIEPQTTRELSAWETQFGIPATLITEQQKRDRLSAVWSALGGQSPRYIQDTLQSFGFDVYIHEWWEPGTKPAIGVKACVTPRNPFDFLTGGVTTQFLASDGSPDMQDGGAFAYDGSTNTNITGQQFLSADGALDMQDGDIEAVDGNNTLPSGYPLVNKELIPSTFLLGDGALDMQDGGLTAQDGGSVTNYFEKIYPIPLDIDKHSYFMYIGGVNFPDHATIQQDRKNEFETLCLKICPSQLWLGMLITYA